MCTLIDYLEFVFALRFDVLTMDGPGESSLLECDAVHIHALCFNLCWGLLKQTCRIDIYVLSCILAQTCLCSNSGICFPFP